MKRITYVLGVLLLLSLALNVKYELKTHQFEKKIHKIVYGKPVLTEEEQINNIPLMQACTENGWQNCLSKLDIQRDVVFYGDSHTCGSDFRQYFPDVSICNLGLGGDDLNGFIRRVGMIQAVHPKKIFFMGGINGSGGITLEEYERKYEILFSAIKDNMPEAMLYVESVLPINSCLEESYCTNEKIQDINIILKELCYKYGYQYIDLYSVYAENGELPMKYSREGIHLKKEYYSMWAETIRPYIYE